MARPRQGRARVLAAGLGITAIAAGCTATGAQAAFPGNNGKIAVVTEAPDGRGIAVMNPNGTGFVRITTGSDFDPTWSADGQWIAFSRGPSETSDIWVVRADGTGLRQVTDSPASESHPSWSPDGRMLAYAGDDPEAPEQVFVVDADGGPARAVVDGDQPAWSPDGERIAYRRYNYPPPGQVGHIFRAIAVVNVDGSGVRDVDYRESSDPDWSPDSTRVTFSTGAVYAVAWMDVDGSNERHYLGTEDSLTQDSTWSPDGEKIGYLSTQSGDRTKFAIENLQTGVVRTVAPPEGVAISDPSWQSTEGVPAPEPVPGPPEPPADNRAPRCSTVRQSATRLPWRPNRKLYPVRLAGGKDPDGDRVTFKYTWVAQDEAVMGRGDHTAPDAASTRERRIVLLRNERSRHGDGRVYYVEFSLTDRWGARCIGSRQVRVRRWKRKPAVAQRALFDSFAVPALPSS